MSAQLDKQISKIRRKRKFHEVTNKWIVEVIRKCLSWLEARAAAIDKRQDALVQLQTDTLLAVEQRKEQEVAAAEAQIKAAKDQAAKDAQNTVEAFSGGKDEIAAAKAGIESARESIRNAV